MRRKYVCTNGVVEVTQFSVGDKQSGSGRWHRSKNQIDKRDENARQAIRVAARVLNCNFSPDDYLLTLTYSDEACEEHFSNLDMDGAWEKAKRLLSKKLEQLRRKIGAELKTFSVTTDMDGETGKIVRVHHHVVVSANGESELRKLWTYGLTHRENLYCQNDYTPLAAYLLNQVRHMEGKKKYSTSRNMIKPEVYEQVLDEDPETEIKTAPGAKVLDRTLPTAGTVSQYVRYKRKEKHKGSVDGGHPPTKANRWVKIAQ